MCASIKSEPHWNESRFYRYPSRRVAAVFDQRSEVDAAVLHLQQAGVAVAKVHVLSGPEGAQLLDRSGARHGFLARLLRVLQHGAYEGDTLRHHERELNGGSHIMFVPLHRKQDPLELAKILQPVGARDLIYFARWSITPL